MSIKTKIITTVVCICCIVSAMVVGILAADRQTFNIGNATVSFTSSQIAFRLEYAISGVKGVEDPTGYIEGGKDIGVNDTSIGSWEIGDLSFNDSGKQPIYIEVSVMLHSNKAERVDRDVNVAFTTTVDTKGIVQSATQNAPGQNIPPISVEFAEIKQLYNESETYTTHLNNYSMGSIEWETLTETNLPQGLIGEGLNSNTNRYGKYTLIFKITPKNAGMNFKDVNVNFGLDFTGTGAGSQGSN